MLTDDYLAPDDFDIDKPSAARIYDYLLGGYSNFEADRQAAEQLLQIAPAAREIAVANRAFLHRAVRYMMAQGITQFLDIGSGIPTVGNVHEVVQRTLPAGRVAYVDIDPVAVEYARNLLEAEPNVVALRADARHPTRILQHPALSQFLDWQQPLGILLVAVLHFLPDDEEAYGTVRHLVGAAAPGSVVALSHVTMEQGPEEVVVQLAKVYAGSATSGKPRSHEEIALFFEGLELQPPGLVWAPLWRPRSKRDPLLDEPERSIALAGVGYKEVE